jgi:hypothetical protein
MFRSVRNPVVPVPIRMLPTQALSTYKMRRTNLLGALSIGATDKGVGYSFALTDIPAYTEFTTIWDQYLFLEVELTFVWQGVGYYPTLYIARDDDGAIVPTAPATVLQYSNCRILPFTTWENTHSMKWRPTPSSSAGVVVGLPTDGNGLGWIDCASPSSLHYGAVAWFRNYNTTLLSYSNIDVYQTYTIAFRGQR